MPLPELVNEAGVKRSRTNRDKVGVSYGVKCLGQWRRVGRLQHDFDNALAAIADSCLFHGRWNRPQCGQARMAFTRWRKDAAGIARTSPAKLTA